MLHKSLGKAQGPWISVAVCGVSVARSAAAHRPCRGMLHTRVPVPTVTRQRNLFQTAVTVQPSASVSCYASQAARPRLSQPAQEQVGEPRTGVLQAPGSSTVNAQTCANASPTKLARLPLQMLRRAAVARSHAPLKVDYISIYVSSGTLPDQSLPRCHHHFPLRTVPAARPCAGRSAAPPTPSRHCGSHTPHPAPPPVTAIRCPPAGCTAGTSHCGTWCWWSSRCTPTERAAWRWPHLRRTSSWYGSRRWAELGRGAHHTGATC